MSKYNDSTYYSGTNVDIGLANYNTRNEDQQSQQHKGAVDITKILEKLKYYSVIAMVLGFLTIVSGATTLGVASKNIGFPVFNFGPLLVGIIFFICGSVGYNACTKAKSAESSSEGVSYGRCGIIAIFALCVTNISLSILSAVFAFLSGAVCAGADITFYNRNNNIRTKLDVKQFCSPHNTANTVLAFIDGGLCVTITVWCIIGTLFFCCYGRYFGIKGRRRGF
ncbi:uncharacterized protein LOC132732197 [Ruditapes philippinarum]|uniref:uncharacterized protein LOC132732197 n=1 Tax=Ruditapes philippinarum TaxID=129788 RepID=UPI00295C08A0|nr:uncharacterized protein LOC132732197 [Ruditapes philippinarum]